MVTIGSGGIPPVGGGMQAMDILKRLGMKRGLGAAASGAFGAPPAAAAPMSPAPMEAPQPMRPEPMAVTPDPMPSSSGAGMVDPMQTGKRFTNPGVFDRIGDFINSDRGRATLLRSGAATMQGGLGAGIMAGAAYNEDQKELEQKQMNWVSEMGLRTRATDIDQQQVDQTGAYQAGQLDNSSLNIARQAASDRETARKNRVTEGIDLVEEEGRNTRFGIGDNTQRRGQDITVRGQDVTVRGQDIAAETAIRGQDNTRYIADENRAYTYGDKGETTVGVGKRSSVKSTKVKPSYDAEIRYDGEGNAYRLDRFTGRPVRVGQ
jgi:hypothetical protein